MSESKKNNNGGQVLRDKLNLSLKQRLGKKGELAGRSSDSSEASQRAPLGETKTEREREFMRAMEQDAARELELLARTELFSPGDRSSEPARRAESVKTEPPKKTLPRVEAEEAKAMPEPPARAPAPLASVASAGNPGAHSSVVNPTPAAPLAPAAAPAASATPSPIAAPIAPEPPIASPVAKAQEPPPTAPAAPLSDMDLFDDLDGPSISQMLKAAPAKPAPAEPAPAPAPAPAMEERPAPAKRPVAPPPSHEQMVFEALARLDLDWVDHHAQWGQIAPERQEIFLIFALPNAYALGRLLASGAAFNKKDGLLIQTAVRKKNWAALDLLQKQGAKLGLDPLTSVAGWRRQNSKASPQARADAPPVNVERKSEQLRKEFGLFFEEHKSSMSPDLAGFLAPLASRAQPPARKPSIFSERPASFEPLSAKPPSFSPAPTPEPETPRGRSIFAASSEPVAGDLFERDAVLGLAAEEALETGRSNEGQEPGPAFEAEESPFFAESFHEAPEPAIAAAESEALSPPERAVEEQAPVEALPENSFLTPDALAVPSHDSTSDDSTFEPADDLASEKETFKEEPFADLFDELEEDLESVARASSEGGDTARSDNEDPSESSSAGLYAEKAARHELPETDELDELDFEPGQPESTHDHAASDFSDDESIQDDDMNPESNDPHSADEAGKPFTSFSGRERPARPAPGAGPSALDRARLKTLDSVLAEKQALEKRLLEMEMYAEAVGALEEERDALLGALEDAEESSRQFESAFNELKGQLDALQQQAQASEAKNAELLAELELARAASAGLDATAKAEVDRLRQAERNLGELLRDAERREAEGARREAELTNQIHYLERREPPAPEALDWLRDSDREKQLRKHLFIENIIKGESRTLEKIARNTSVELDLANLGLVFAAEAGQVKCAEWLLAEMGVDIHFGQELALLRAVEAKQTEMALWLIERGANLHHADEFALRRAIKDDNLALLDKLIAVGANPHCAKQRPLREALASESWNCFKALLAYGANPNNEMGQPMAEFAESEQAMELISWAAAQRGALKEIDSAFSRRAAAGGIL